MKAIGARVIAMTRASRKADILRQLGADVVVVTEEENLVDRVFAETGGKGAEVVYDGVGGAQLASLG